MPLELKLLVWTAALTIVQMLVAAIAGAQQLGVAPSLGNREPALELTGWAGRAQRAHRNMLEYFPLFAALVLVAQATGKLAPRLLAVSRDRGTRQSAGPKICLWRRNVGVAAF